MHNKLIILIACTVASLCVVAVVLESRSSHSNWQADLVANLKYCTYRNVIHDSNLRALTNWRQSVITLLAINVHLSSLHKYT